MNVSTDRWDVVVVGGGPAGAATAARLASSGRRVLLVDRSAFPRPKPCGESVNPGAVRELGELGVLQRVLEHPHVRIDGWRIHPIWGGSFQGCFPGQERGIGIDRSQLDAVLLRKAADRGAEVRTGIKIVDVLRKNGAVMGVRTSTGDEILGRVVVGADGLRSVVVRRLSLVKRPPKIRKVALTAHLRGVDVDGGIGALHMRAWGCVGIARIAPDVVNVVVVLDRPDASLAAGANRTFDAAVDTVPVLRGAIRMDPVLATGPFDWPTRRVTTGGALLVGDAAGYFDPFTGQGIFRALRGARLAAETIDRCLDAGDTSADALSTYERAHRRAFDPGRRLQYLIEGVVSRPRVLGTIAAAFRKWPVLTERLFAITGDLAPVRSFLISPRNP